MSVHTVGAVLAFALLAAVISAALGMLRDHDDTSTGNGSGARERTRRRLTADPKPEA